MPEDTPRIADPAPTAIDRAGFCDRVFKAYYGGGDLAATGARGNEPAPRSRNTYMRTRARRLAAAARER